MEQNIDNPSKNKKIILIIGVVLLVVLVILAIIVLPKVFNKNGNNNETSSNNESQNKKEYSKSYYDINDIEISKLGHYLSWSVGWKGTVNFLVRKPLGDKYDYYHYEKNENGVIIIADSYIDIYNNQSIDSVMEQSKDKIIEYLNKSLKNDIKYDITFTKGSMQNISSSEELIKAIYSEIYNSGKFGESNHNMLSYNGKITDDKNNTMKLTAYVTQSNIEKTYYTYMLVIDGSDNQSIDNSVLEKYALDMAHTFYEHNLKN